MRITDLLSPDGIILDVSFCDKAQVINQLVDLQALCGSLNNKQSYCEAVFDREAQVATAIERGIAVPHAKTDAVKKPFITVAKLEKGIACGALDGKPSDLFFLLAVPADANLHIEILSRLMTLLMDDIFASDLRNAKTNKEFLQIINEAETKKLIADVEQPLLESYNILAVTACPLGIAHTFLAADALRNAADKQGFSIKVETNGSDAVKDKLTDAEIAVADAIIVATDIGVDISRFDGKPVIFTTVTSGISNATELVSKAMGGKTVIYHTEIDTEEQVVSGKKLRQQLYTHLMSGISYMLPFIVGGGILIALAYAIDDYSINPANFGMNTPFAAFLKTAGTMAFHLMLPIMSAFIAYSIGDRVALCVGFVGGMFAYTGFTLGNYNTVSAVSSGFFGALVTGFIAGYLVVLLRKIFSVLPKSMSGLKSTFIFPILGILGICFFTCLINPFAAHFSQKLVEILTRMGTEHRILLGCVLGAMMSVDMGGPVGKAAYIFGTAAIATSNYEIMASVMVGGMVAPLAIAVAATFFKNKFTHVQRKSAYTNYILGLCFVTEGAIPFAASDAFRIIPSCMLGSAIAGGLSMAYGCQLFAPHGGIFIFPLVKNVIGYLISLGVGTAVAALIIGITRRKISVKDRMPK